MYSTLFIELIYAYLFTMKISGEDLLVSVTPSAFVQNVSSVPCSQMLQLVLFTTMGDKFPHPYRKTIFLTKMTT
jgi:hypothetical protein